MKIIRAISVGVAIWILGVSAYTVSFYLTIIEDVELQSNVVLLFTIIPLVWFGSAFYNKQDRETHGFLVGLTFLLVSGVLDALITVPVFMMPNGIDHYAFFTTPGFWLIALVFVSTAVLYYKLRVVNRTVILKQ